MEENGRQRLPPDLLTARVVGDLFRLGRTRLYESYRDGSIPSVQGVGRLRLTRTKWVLQELDLTPEELAERLPEEAWSPPRKRAKGGRRK